MPEIGHGTRVGIGTETTPGLELTTEVFQVGFAEPAFQEGAGVNPRCRMGLGHDNIAAIVLATSAEAVLKTHFKHGCRRGVGGDMPTDTATLIRRLQHHRHGVPADNVLDALFQFNIAGVDGLLRGRNGIDVGRVEGGLAQWNAPGQHMILQGTQNIPHTALAVFTVNVIEGFNPFLTIISQLIDETWQGVDGHGDTCSIKPDFTVYGHGKICAPGLPACTMLVLCTDTLEEFLMVIDPGPYDLNSVRFILGPDGAGTTKPVGANFYEELDSEFQGFRGHLLVSRFGFAEPWPTWEVHPEGDELVYLLDGDTDFVLWVDGEEEVVRVSEPGSYVVVPRGTWHAGRPHAPTDMLFLTPGEGTLNAEHPTSTETF